MKPVHHKSIAVKALIVILLGTIGYFGFARPIFAQNAGAAANSLSISPMDKAIQDERNKAVDLARNGQYDAALTSLAKLHDHYPEQAGITADYIAVLGWAGHDEESVHLYETVPAEQPDYVLAAVGHSYRAQNQLEKSLAAYRLGQKSYPDNVTFVEGEIRVLADQGKLDEASALADADLHAHGDRAEIVTAKADVVRAQMKVARDNAVQLARDGKYADALTIFRGNLLDAEHTTDPEIRRDYLATLAWAGNHDADVVSIYKTLKEDEQTDYVLLAAAKAYRNQRHPEIAIELYRKGMKAYSDNNAFAMGEIRCLMDMKKVDEAAKKIDAYESVHGKSDELEAAKRDIATIRFNAVRAKAAKLARAGKYDQALAVLRKLGGEHTKNIGILQDRIAILGWMGGHDQDVVNQYLALRNPNQPDYVLEAVGKAYRDLGQTDKALAVYENGLRRHPSNEIFAVGTIRTLTDSGYVEKALGVANANLQRYGNRLEVLLAAADAANMYDQNDALKYYQTAARIAPKNPEVQRGLIRTADRLGAPQEALKIIRANPGIVSDSERRQIEGDEAAALVRLGQLDQEEGRSTDGTDRAIDNIDNRISQWQSEGGDAQVAINRARFDRIIALHNRSRFKESIAEYNSLVSEGAEPPVFVTGAVGDAYLDSHEPEKARDLYLKVLENEPKNNRIRRQLFYAYVDLGEYKNAYGVADSMVRDGSVWNREKNIETPMTDGQRRDVELTAGAARLYFGEVREADKLLLPVIAANPDSPAAHEALGNLDNAHGWPRHALEQYQIGTELAGGENLSNEVGAANTNLSLHNFAEAGAEMSSLLQRYPENLSVQRAKRDWDVYNMAELDITAGVGFPPSTSQNVTGGQSYGIDTRLYSMPFWYNWRIFAGEYFTHQKEPSQEGSIGYSRTTAGAEYRKGPVTAELAPTYNAYHGTERVGVEASGSYGINDYWTVAGSGELFSRDTPLRALNHGITADEVGAHAVWQEDESRSVRFGFGMMPFSDGNFRTGENADYTQRVWTTPYFRVDGLGSVGFDQNSKDENRSYYNPSSDMIGLVGARAIQTLYQRYATLWQHTLQVTPGFYAQEHYGTSATVRARYEHRVFLNQSFEAGLGVNFQRQAYDGVPENDLGLSFDMVDHF